MRWDNHMAAPSIRSAISLVSRRTIRQRSVSYRNVTNRQPQHAESIHASQVTVPAVRSASIQLQPMRRQALRPLVPLQQLEECRLADAHRRLLLAEPPHQLAPAFYHPAPTQACHWTTTAPAARCSDSTHFLVCAYRTRWSGPVNVEPLCTSATLCHTNRLIHRWQNSANAHLLSTSRVCCS